MIKNLLKPSNKICLIRSLKRDNSTTSEIIESASTSIEYEEDMLPQINEEEINRKRNKSRLLPQHRNMLHEKVPYSEPQSWIHETVKYQKKVFGRYGSSSNVFPGICWPTKEELKDKIEYECIAHPKTIPEMVEEINKEKETKRLAIQKRQEEITKKVEKLVQWEKELQDKIAAKEAQARAAKERKDRLVEDVRRHFGFKLDPRDERFKEMLEKKEREDKKNQKEAKRKVKEARMIAKLTEMHANKSETTT